MDIEFSRIILKLKIAMLCNGVYISKSTLTKIQNKNKLTNLGRKGGAGPSGGRYFKIIYIGEKNESIKSTLVNAQIWVYDDLMKSTPEYLEKNPSIIIFDIKDDYEVKYKGDLTWTSGDIATKPSQHLKINENVRIELIKTPKFYSQNTKDNINLKKIGLIHGNFTYATTIHQKCRYWRKDRQKCKFCGIEHSLESNTTLMDKTPQQIIEGLKVAEKENPSYISNITLTSGSFEDSKQGMEKYYKIIKEIKKQENFPGIKIHIQTEPIENIEYYKILKEIGADTIGIHLEILDDQLRKKICPGKSEIPKKTYFLHWKKAIEIFGKNQVSSYILLGFEKDIIKFKRDLEEIIKIGVVPLLTPTRFFPDELGEQSYSPLISYDTMYNILMFAAKKLKENNIDPTKHKAGCIRCGGCSAIIEAYKYI